MLNREKDQWGHNFQFVLNGVPLFAKGGDYIPMDSLITARAMIKRGNCSRIAGMRI